MLRCPKDDSAPLVDLLYELNRLIYNGCETTTVKEMNDALEILGKMEGHIRCAKGEPILCTEKGGSEVCRES